MTFERLSQYCKMFIDDSTLAVEYGRTIPGNDFEVINQGGLIDIIQLFSDIAVSKPEMNFTMLMDLCDEYVDLDPQSGELSYSTKETMRSQNVKFSDQYNGPTTEISGRPDKTRCVTDTNDTELSNFFSRPIKIDTLNWAVGGNLNSVIDPWSLYFSNPRVQNRITTYNLMRADLHIKIVINGNGFYFGRGIAAYRPFASTTYDTLSSTLALADMTQWSQCPKIFIDPTSSMAGEMVIPFHHFQNNAWVQNSDWTSLGDLWIRSLNVLKHANGGTDGITVSIFAWAENVELSVLTSMDMGGLTPQSGVLEPQSGEVDEANSKGVISKPASTIAKIAGYLTQVPVIGPYALATQKVGNVTSAVAKSFGYCRPVLTKAPEPYRPTVVSSLANTSVPDVVSKLTVDDKQELTIDPTISGIGHDDVMSIKSIGSRESYLTTFDWAKSTSDETLLWNCRVDPTVWNSTGGGDFLFPACGAAALPFRYWTGTMKFRFQIVCSSFHKGRLKIVYDPNTLSSNEYNTNYLKIIDIADEQDITIEVGIGQTTTLLTHSQPGVDLITSMYNTTALPYSATLGNGVIGIYTVNKLTTPNTVADNDIQVNVYVSMGDDFEVFVPDEHFQRFVLKPQSGDFDFTLTPQSGVISESVLVDEPNAPEKQNSENIAVDNTNMPELNLVFTGESIQSFRTMLKRYNRYYSFSSHNSGPYISILGSNAFPLLRGNVAGAVHGTAALGTYNYVNTLMLHWVTLMYSGWRGSIRYKALPRRILGYLDMGVTRHADGLGFQLTRTAAPVFTSGSQLAESIVVTTPSVPIDAMVSGTEGMAYCNSAVNPTLEWEMPFYSQYRFVPGKTQNWTTANTFVEYFALSVSQVMDPNQLADAIYNVGNIELYVAVGEDFQTYMFSGLPRVYYEANPPTPAP